ncbi:ATP-binding protein [Streptomyces sp. NPDC005507]|uniref:ATP-binding protein n=1 Tax=Streptomyces sp. NPDC005507 TaxID=3154885 RepID=UPI0033BC024B
MVHSSEEDEEYGSLAGVSPHLAKGARDVTRGFLLTLAPDGDGAEVESVLLVVPELVTNAVRHAGGLTGFGLRVGQGTVTVSVGDASRVPPQWWPADSTRPGGFGRPLVQSLATEVQVSGRRGGKTVSAMLPFSDLRIRECHLLDLNPDTRESEFGLLTSSCER